MTHRHLHQHGAGAHGGSGHGAAGAHTHRHLLTLARRPFLIGLLHGMAGSAALMLLVLAAIPSAGAGMLYVLVFGIGSTAGMLLLSGLLGIPFLITARRSQATLIALTLVTGSASLLLGCWIAWPLAGP